MCTKDRHHDFDETEMMNLIHQAKRKKEKQQQELLFEDEPKRGKNTAAKEKQWRLTESYEDRSKEKTALCCQPKKAPAACDPAYVDPADLCFLFYIEFHAAAADQRCNRYGCRAAVFAGPQRNDLRCKI